MSKVVLGKGLEALIPGDGGAVAEDRQLREVPLNLIAPNPMQPRRHFDESSLAELAESFRRNGVMQPLVVQKTGSTFTIIAGERRFRAARMANLEQVPVVLMSDVDDSRMLELALVENLQREDLNPMETAEASRALIDSCGLTQAELAARLGKSRTAVTNLLRLLSLPDRIKQMIRQGSLTEGHARAILAVESEAEQLRLADSIINDSLSVREVERRAGHTRKKRPGRSRVVDAADPGDLGKDPSRAQTRSHRNRVLFRRRSRSPAGSLQEDNSLRDPRIKEINR